MNKDSTIRSRLRRQRRLLLTLQRNETMRERIDRPANCQVAWNLPPAVVITDWHVDELGNLSRTVGMVA